MPSFKPVRGRFHCSNLRHRGEYQKTSGWLSPAKHIGEPNKASSQKLVIANISYESEMARPSGELYEALVRSRNEICVAADFARSTIAPQVAV